MISLQKIDNVIKFTFQNNDHYLQNGTIEVPVNSLSLVTDESEMFTFKKSATNDVFVSGLYSEIGMTKAELETFYKENMVGSTGGGTDSGMVQTMIDESISGKVDTTTFNTALSGKADYSAATYMNDVVVYSGHCDGEYTEFPFSENINIYHATSVSGNRQLENVYIDYSSDGVTTKRSYIFGIHSSETDVYKWEVSADKTDYLLTMKGDNRLVAIEPRLTTSGQGWPKYQAISRTEVVAAPTIRDVILPALSGKVDTTTFNQALSGKQDTLIAGENITISGNVISAEGGSSVNVVQTSGASSADVMSQDAVTTLLKNKANYGSVIGSYQYGEIHFGDSIVNYLQFMNGNYNPNNSIYYPKINGIPIITSSSYLASKSYNIQLVPTSAVTSAVTSASTDTEIPSAKAVYDAMSQGGGAASSAITSGDTNAVQGGAVYDRFDEVEQVTSRALNELNNNFGGLKLVRTTQDAYDAITTKDENTIYIIKD